MSTKKTFKLGAFSALLAFSVSIVAAANLTGRVTTSSGQGVSGVIVDSNNSMGMRLTDANGNYSFDGVSHGTSFNLTASKGGYSFAPQNQIVTVFASSQVRNFTATQTGYTISGFIRDSNGQGVGGVNVSSGGALGNSVTGSDGFYSFTGVAYGTGYNLLPTKAGFTFSPPSAAGTAFGDIGLNFLGSALTPNPTPSPTPAPVSNLFPILDCVDKNANGTFTAHFGYQNSNLSAVTVPLGTQNRFSPSPENRGQPTFFVTGRVVNHFLVGFDGSLLQWQLAGFTATASTGSPLCFVLPPTPPSGCTTTVDQCGVCGGNGTSCLGCVNTNIAATQLEMDGGTFELKGLVKKATNRLKKVSSSKSTKTFISKTRKQANKLHTDAWFLIYSLPSVMLNCTNSTLCVQVDNTSVLSQYNSSSLELNNLLQSVIDRKEQETGTLQKKDNTLLKKGDSRHNANLFLSNSVPRSQSSCN